MLMLWEYIAEAVGCYINVSHETQFLHSSFFEVIVNFFFFFQGGRKCGFLLSFILHSQCLHQRIRRWCRLVRLTLKFAPILLHSRCPVRHRTVTVSAGAVCIELVTNAGLWRHLRFWGSRLNRYWEIILAWCRKLLSWIHLILLNSASQKYLDQSSD